MAVEAGSDRSLETALPDTPAGVLHRPVAPVMKRLEETGYVFEW